MNTRRRRRIQLGSSSKEIGNSWAAITAQNSHPTHLFMCLKRWHRLTQIIAWEAGGKMWTAKRIEDHGHLDQQLNLNTTRIQLGSSSKEIGNSWSAQNSHPTHLFMCLKCWYRLTQIIACEAGEIWSAKRIEGHGHLDQQLNLNTRRGIQLGSSSKEIGNSWSAITAQYSHPTHLFICLKCWHRLTQIIACEAGGETWTAKWIEDHGHLDKQLNLQDHGFKAGTNEGNCRSPQCSLFCS